MVIEDISEWDDYNILPVFQWAAMGDKNKDALRKPDKTLYKIKLDKTVK